MAMAASTVAVALCGLSVWCVAASRAESEVPDGGGDEGSEVSVSRAAA